jgi:hypothetical protein
MHMGLRESTSRGRVVTLRDGRVLELRPLVLRDLAQLEEQSLADYKRQYLSTFSANRDLMPPELAADLYKEAFQTAAAMSVESLPVKMHGGKPIPYAFWWAEHSISGMLHAAWLSVRRADPSIKFDDLDKILRADLAALEQIVDAVGELSSPSEGNGFKPVERTTPANHPQAQSAGLSS